MFHSNRPANGDSTAQIKLPPGWTEADMQKCLAAATPGKMHQYLAKSVGSWHGKQTLWMFGGSDPITSECASTVATIMEGRYTRCEVTGELPGMGPYNGLGLYGFDNVSGQFVSTWIDNHNTGIMTGAGQLSADGKTLTWTYNHTCPITQKPAVLRELEIITGDNTKTLEIFATDPKTGKEFQTMRIEFTRK
jgi:hypothetical protein